MDDLNQMFHTRADDIRPSPRAPFWKPRFKLPSGLGLDYGAYGQVIVKLAVLEDGTVDWTRCFRQRAYARSGYYESGHLSPVPDTVTLPKGFMPSTGTDNQADIITPDGWTFVWGYLNNYMAMQQDPFGGLWAVQKLYNSLRRPQMADMDCAVGTVARVAKNHRGNAGYYSGPVCPIFPGVATADEIAAGEIDHFLSWTMSLTMGGPVAPRSILSVNDEKIGTVYKAACAPAMGIEKFIAKVQPTVYTGIMMGQPWRADPAIWTPARHDAWVMSKPLANRHAADVFGKCLVNYGLLPNQSGPHDIVPLNPREATRLKALGVTPTLLDGFDFSAFTPLDPVWATYTDGTEGNREGMIAEYAFA